MSDKSIMRLMRRLHLTIVAGLVVSCVVGCASAPVQQMSDARQAIRAAQDAGAATVAPQSLAEAQSALSRAQSLLNKRFFRAARRSAEEAHQKAVEAMQQVRLNKSGPSGSQSTTD